MRNLFIVILACLFSATVYAEDELVHRPDLQTAQPDFFDPTRKIREEYHFSTQWRVEVGFEQWHQRTANLSYPDAWLHGARIGGTVDFMLPKHFSVQTGLLATITYGKMEQHYRSMSLEYTQVERLENCITQLELTIPARVYYNVTLWRQLRMFFFTGPQLQIGLVSHDKIVDGLSDEVRNWLVEQNIHVQTYDRYRAKELYRTNIQWGLGGGLEWDCYRLQGGYDFGLNNLVRNRVLSTQSMQEWGWMVSFAYRF